MPAPHIERMMEEGNQLTDRIQKLQAFILTNPAYQELVELDLSLLQAQLSAMTTYLNILNLRLAAKPPV